MNEIIKCLFDRKSVRQYEARPILPEDKTLILQAALQAPTAGNQNLYTILDITDQALKQQLSVYCDNQPFIAQAPLALVFLADCRRWYDSYQMAGLEARPPEEGDLLLAIADAVIAAQNTVVAAESLGIGSCYIGDILEREEDLRKALALDDVVFPAAFVVYGYPTANQKERKKPLRPPLTSIVQENQYRRLTEAEHKDLFLAKGNIKHEDGFKEYMTAFCTRKYMSDFAKEMNRSARRYLKHFRRRSESN
ncbi:MAG: nitroreductase family protein [Treponema sp.]|nr:nitroreductase family protein [Treponema sp.]